MEPGELNFTNTFATKNIGGRNMRGSIAYSKEIEKSRAKKELETRMISLILNHSTNSLNCSTIPSYTRSWKSRSVTGLFLSTNPTKCEPDSCISNCTANQRPSWLAPTINIILNKLIQQDSNLQPSDYEMYGLIVQLIFLLDSSETASQTDERWREGPGCGNKVEAV